MKIGFVGLGKLGLPVALAVENKGHEVVGYDINPAVKDYVANRKIPYEEIGTPELLSSTKIGVLDSVEEVVGSSDIVFVAIQTPHNPMYEGITRIPKERVNFDYTYLKSGVEEISEAAEKLKRHIVLIIISTVLPGTIEQEIVPLLNEYIHLCYNPFFIAMGTTRRDFENPEFVLLGCDGSNSVVDKVKEFYATIHDRPVFVTRIKNAELIKVTYNTYISTKIAFINTIMEVCEKTGADVDAVSDALSLATERIISSKYLRGGMGDGGGCHPRDNIALSWLARKLNLSYDYFEHIMLSREKQTDWLADEIQAKQKETSLPIVILGKAFKKGTNLVVGSSAILLSNILRERGVEVAMFDPHVDRQKISFTEPSIFFIGTNHDEFTHYAFPVGSVIIDPWGIIKDQDGVVVKRLGRS